MIKVIGGLAVVAVCISAIGAALMGGAVVYARTMTAPDEEIAGFLRELESCPPEPCLMGIQPSVTTTDEVDALFRRNVWVEQFFYTRGMAVGSGMIRWTWSGAQPGFIDARIDGTMWIEDGRVLWIEIPTRVRMGEMWFIYPPERGAAFTTSAAPPRLIYWGLSVDNILQLRLIVTCPSRVGQLWNTTVLFRVGALESALMNANTPLRAFSPRLRCPYL